METGAARNAINYARRFVNDSDRVEVRYRGLQWPSDAVVSWMKEGDFESVAAVPAGAQSSDPFSTT